MIATAEHPLLDLACGELALPAPLGELAAPDWLGALLRAPDVDPGDAVRAAVRDLLRGNGFKPTGRSKPSSEYLANAAREARLQSINLVVDLGNAASLHSGLPISVVDAARLAPPLRVALAASDARYVFNASGQEIDVGGLLCLHDATGPCANAVKDAQRTKTDATTRRALVLVWGTRVLPGSAAQVAAELAQLAARAGLLYTSQSGGADSRR